MDVETLARQSYCITLPTIARAAGLSYFQSKLIVVEDQQIDEDTTTLEIETDEWQMTFSSIIYAANNVMKQRLDHYERTTGRSIRKTNNQIMKNNPNDPEMLIDHMKKMIGRKAFRDPDLGFMYRVMDVVLECRRDTSHEEDVLLIPRCDHYLTSFIELAKPTFLDVPKLLQRAMRIYKEANKRNPALKLVSI